MRVSEISALSFTSVGCRFMEWSQLSFGSGGRIDASPFPWANGLSRGWAPCMEVEMLPTFIWSLWAELEALELRHFL